MKEDSLFLKEKIDRFEENEKKLKEDLKKLNENNKRLHEEVAILSDNNDKLNEEVNSIKQKLEESVLKKRKKGELDPKGNNNHYLLLLHKVL